MNIQSYKSPIGNLIIEANDLGVSSIKFKSVNIGENPNLHTQNAVSQLKEYFESKRQSFDVELNPMHASEFYHKVWDFLKTIPYGRTCSYLDIAKELGDANAVRAVGMANGKNPIPIIVPCHRVIGSDKSLTGFAWGTDIKRKLLALENPKEWAENGELF